MPIMPPTEEELLQHNLNEEDLEEVEEEEPSDSSFFHLDFSYLKVYCEVCERKKGHLICKDCKVGAYCSTSCQRVGWERHKSYCKQLKKMREKVAEEEENLRHCDDNWSGEMMNYFEERSCIGHFWSILETRPYCRSLMNIVTVCQNYRTTTSIKQAVVLVMRLLYLCRGDNLGVRYLAPHYLLQLGNDQAAYDFIKYWEEDGYDGDAISSPYLYFWQADLSEPLISDGGCLQHSVACLLVKLRYYERCLQRESFQKGFILSSMSTGTSLSRFGGNGLVLRHIYSYLLPAGTFVNRSVKSSEGMLLQVKEQVQKIEKYCGLMIQALANPQPILRMKMPGSYSSASPEEVYLTLANAFTSWSQTPFALEFLRDHCTKVYRSLDYKVKPTRF